MKRNNQLMLCEAPNWFTRERSWMPLVIIARPCPSFVRAVSYLTKTFSLNPFLLALWPKIQDKDSKIGFAPWRVTRRGIWRKREELKERRNERAQERKKRRKEWVRKKERKNGRKNEWKNEWMNEWRNEWIYFSIDTIFQKKYCSTF